MCARISESTLEPLVRREPASHPASQVGDSDEVGGETNEQSCAIAENFGIRYRAHLGAGYPLARGDTEGTSGRREGRVIVQAHRGGPALGAPENSLELFQRARDARVDLVEMDVVFTKDKVAIVNHDDKIKDVSSYVVNGVTVPKLDRTHEGKKIHDMTASRWRRCAAGATRCRHSPK